MENGSNTLIQDSQGKLSPKEIFFKYMVYLPWFIVSLAFTITIGYLYIRYSVPLYNSAINILVKSERNRGNAPAEISLDNLVAARNTNLSNEIVVLKSASTMRRVVNSLGLELQYYGKGKVKSSELYTYSPIKATILSETDSVSTTTLTFSKINNSVEVNWDGKKAKVTDGSVLQTSKGALRISIDPKGMDPDFKYLIYWKSDWAVAGELSGRLDVKQQNKDAGVLTMSIITEIPERGKDVLNQLVKEYDLLTIEDRNRLALNSIKFIDDRLEILAQELGKVEDNMQGFQSANKIVDLPAQSAAGLAKMNTLEGELNTEEVQLRVIKMVNEYVGNPSRKYELVPSTLGIEDATLTELIGKYNQLQLSRDEDLKTIPSTHPAIKVKESQIEKVRVSILENLSNVRQSAESIRNQKLREYNSSVSSLSTLPAKKRELIEIERQKGIKEKLYLYLLQKREELAITKASTSGTTTAIDPAYSFGPVSPNTSNIYRLAFIIGILLPVAFIYIRDLLNDKIIVRSDITKVTDTPIMGEIAHHNTMDRKFVVGLKDRTVLAEQFRIIRTNLQYLLTSAPSRNPVFLVTSTIAGEGKTFCSMNLAAVWAVAGKKTVILELDLRKPKISASLGLQRNIGISNYVLGHARKEELPQAIPDLPNLYVIGAGPIPPNPSELIMDTKMDELFTYLRANFDTIIIDSAPIGLVSDSKILSRFADATMYVVRQRYTVKKQMAFVNELHKDKILPNMGLIVNDVRIGGASSYYGYGYGYGYGYSYNYNYSYSYGEKDKRSFVRKVRDFVGL